MLIRDDTNTYNSLYHRALEWARADSTNFTFEQYVGYANSWLDKVAAIIKRHDNTWKWKDTNDPNELISTSLNLQIGVSKYAISAAWLKIARIRLKQPDGTFRTLDRKDRRAFSDEELAGSIITGYYFLGGHFYLGGIPAYGAANGLEVQFQGTAVHIDPDDLDNGVLDMEPGFNPEQHEIIALGPALDYLEINGPDEQARKVEKKIGVEPRQGVEGTGLLGALAASYSERDDAPQDVSLEKSGRARGLLC